MGKFTNFLKNAKNRFSNNLKEYNKAKDEESGASDIKKTILWIKVALAAVPIVFFGAGVVIIVMVAAAPMIVVTGVVTDIADSVKDFGASVGNFFTSGCYGTDAECAAKEEAKAEQAFFDAVEKAYKVYTMNEGNAMAGDLKNGDKINNANQSGWEKTGYSVILNVPVLLSTFMYEKSPSDGYYELVNGTNYINDIANITKKMDVLANNYKWYADANDVVGVNYDELIKKSGADLKNGKCGSYNETFKKAIAKESGYTNLLEYHNPEDKNWWYQLGDFFHVTDHYEESQMRLIAKKLITKKINSTCTSGKISTTVTYEYDEDAYKKFLKDEYLKDVLVAKYITERYEEWLKSKGVAIVNGDVVRTDGSALSKSEKETIKTEGDAKLNEIKATNYTPTDREYEIAIDTIISSSEYFEYIYDELMESKGIKVKICKGVNVIVDGDTENQELYELEKLVAGFTTNLEKIYAKSGTAVEKSVREAASIIYRTYIIDRSEFCTEPIHVTTREDGKYMQYVEPSANATDAADATRGQVIYSKEDILASNNTTYDYLAYVNQYNSRPGAGQVAPSRPSAPNLTVTYPIPVKLQSLESAASTILAANRTAEEIIKKYYTGYPEIALKRVTGNLVGGKYASAAPKRTETGSPAENGKQLKGAVDLEGKQIYNSKAGNIGQCVWYAKHRAIEIVTYSDMDPETKAKAINAINNTYRDGAGWNANNSDLDLYFGYSNDPTQPKAGSFITWAGGSSGGSTYYYDAKGNSLQGYGHVAIVEEVLPDGRIVVSEGWKQKPWENYSGWDGVRVQYQNIYDLARIKGTSSRPFAGYIYLLG